MGTKQPFEPASGDFFNSLLEGKDVVVRFNNDDTKNCYEIERVYPSFMVPYVVEAFTSIPGQPPKYEEIDFSAIFTR